MRIVVTGAAGQLGGELCRQLGAQALPLDRTLCDLTDVDSTRRALDQLAPTAVINAAAYTQVDKAETEVERCFAVNEGAVQRLADYCRDQDIPLVQISSDYVFGADVERRTPYTESDVPGPQGVYARSKLASEAAARTWRRHLVIRTCGLYIDSDRSPVRGRNFVDTMLALGRERPSLKIVNDQWCTPSYVPHVARAIAWLLATDRTGVYHVVHGGATTWFDFAAKIFELAKLPVALEPITAAQYGAPAPRPGYSVLDTAKYHALNGPPLPSWQEGLQAYFQSLAARSL